MSYLRLEIKIHLLYVIVLKFKTRSLILLNGTEPQLVIV
jgi:hypothetical protein